MPCSPARAASTAAFSAEQVGLAGDLLHDGDLLGDGLHRLDGAADRLAASLGVLGRLAGDLLGLGGVVGVLLDVGGHLLHRGGGFLGRRGLLGRALRQLLGARRTAPGCPTTRCPTRQCLGDDAAQLLDHAIDVADQVADLVIGNLVDRGGEIAVRDRLGEVARPGKPAADDHRDPDTGADGDQQRSDHGGDQQRTVLLIIRFGIRLRLLHEGFTELDDFLQLRLCLVGPSPGLRLRK